MPRFLAQVREVLDPARVPKVHAETAVEAERRPDSRCSTEKSRRRSPRCPPDRAGSPARQRREGAQRACRSTRSGSRSACCPKPRAISASAPQLYDQKLAFALFSPLSRQEIRARAESELAATRAAMYEIARQVLKGRRGAPPTPEKPSAAQQQRAIKAALELAYAERPQRDARARRRARRAGRRHAVRAREEPRDGARRAARDHRDAGVPAGRGAGVLRFARPARSGPEDLLRGLADPGALDARAGRFVPARIQLALDPQPHDSRGDAGPLPAARACQPVSVDAARGAGRPARSSKAGRCTPNAS